MFILITILAIILSAIFFILWQKERREYFKIRIGRRGSSVIAAEMNFDNNFELVDNIINQIKGLNGYHVFLICSGVSEKAPNKSMSEKEYFIDKLTTHEMENFKIFRQFKDISLFFLNEEVEDRDKILLSHDLIVNSAQIPDREILLESGLIITIIDQSNIIVFTGVKGTFERILLMISDYIFSIGKKVVLSKM